MFSPDEALKMFPPVPDRALFSLQRITQEHWPHPYLLGPGHVKWARRRGIVTPLDDVILREADQDGIPCGVPGCKLSWDGHLVVCLWISVPRKILDAQEIPGLWPYLLRVQSLCRLLGVHKFVFPYPGMTSEGGEDNGWIEVAQTLKEDRRR